ncbi:hypothetical protein PHISCL_11228, partial [Aspergillus sclerotialis]
MTKDEHQDQLRWQKEMLDTGPKIYENGFAKLDQRELEIANTVFRHWSQQNYVRMAEK